MKNVLLHRKILNIHPRPMTQTVSKSHYPKWVENKNNKNNKNKTNDKNKNALM